jgi:DNA-binding CsgD family transcriptional regulator
MSDIQSINAIRFTPKEIDVIACIINLRSDKKIANILSIAPSTVATHIQNIFSKISCNSKEHVQDFVEKSDKLHQINKHYFELLAKNYFRNHLIKEISKLTSSHKQICLFIIAHKSNVLGQIAEYLKLAGIEVIDSANINSEDNAYELKILTSEDITLIEAQQSTSELKNKIFINTDNNLQKDINLKDVHIINWDAQNHIAIFGILKIIIPSINLAQYISSFTNTYNNILLGKRNILKCEIEANNSINSNLSTLLQNNFSASNLKKIIVSFWAILAMVVGFKISAILSLQEVAPNQKISNSVHPVSYFVNHVKQLDEIKDKLEKYGQASIVGTSGIGKTQLIRMYAYENNSSYDLIWFLDCNLDLNDEFLKLAKAINAMNGSKIIDENAENSKKEVINYLSHKKHWLLVFDNLKVKENDKVKDLIKWEHNGDVIFGSQESQHMPYTIKMTSFNKSDVGKIVRDILNSSDPKLTQFLIGEFQGYPVMVVQGAQLLNKIEGLSLDEYKKKIQTSDDKIMTNVQLVLEQLPPSAKQLLHKIALINNQSFSKNILKLITDNPNSLDDDIYQLSKFALLSVANHNQDNPIFEMHDVVVDKVLILDNSEINNRESLSQIIERISNEIPRSGAGQCKFIKDNITLKGNLEIILENAEKYNVSFEEILRLRSNLLALYLTNLDYYNCQKMEQWLTAKQKEQKFNFDKIDQKFKVYYASYNLDMAIFEDFAKSNFTDALIYLNKASSIIEDVQDESELKFGILLQTAQTYIWSGDVERSEFNIEKAKKIIDQYPQSELDFGLYWFIVAKTELLKGSYAQALEAIEKNIQVDSQLSQDTFTAPTYMLQAEILNTMGNYNQALPIIERIYNQELLGKNANHEFHARLLTTLASSQASLGKLEAALKHINQACEIFENEMQKYANHNANNSDHAAALVVKGDVLFKKNDFKEAVNSYNKAEDIYLNRYGENFGKTQDITYLLAQRAKADIKAQNAGK